MRTANVKISSNRATAFIGILAFLLASGCQRQPYAAAGNAGAVSPAGWKLWKTQGIPNLRYVPASNSKIRFVGYCDAAPDFWIDGGPSVFEAKYFDLSINGKFRSFHTWQGMHGGGQNFAAWFENGFADKNDHEIKIENISIAMDMAATRSSIDVNASNGWHFHIPASPLIKQFIDDCISARGRVIDKP